MAWWRALLFGNIVVLPYVYIYVCIEIKKKTKRIRYYFNGSRYFVVQVDERAVLKHFDWPEQKADALREAAFGYCDLKKLESEASSFRDDPRQPCGPALKKMQALFDKYVNSWTLSPTWQYNDNITMKIEFSCAYSLRKHSN